MIFFIKSLIKKYKNKNNVSIRIIFSLMRRPTTDQRTASMKPMQVITRRLTSPRAPSTSQTASIWTCTRQSLWKDVREPQQPRRKRRNTHRARRNAKNRRRSAVKTEATRFTYSEALLVLYIYIYIYIFLLVC